LKPSNDNEREDETFSDKKHQSLKCISWQKNF